MYYSFFTWIDGSQSRKSSVSGLMNFVKRKQSVKHFHKLFWRGKERSVLQKIFEIIFDLQASVLFMRKNWKRKEKYILDFIYIDFFQI